MRAVVGALRRHGFDVPERQLCAEWGGVVFASAHHIVCRIERRGIGTRVAREDVGGETRLRLATLECTVEGEPREALDAALADRERSLR